MKVAPADCGVIRGIVGNVHERQPPVRVPGRPPGEVSE